MGILGLLERGNLRKGGGGGVDLEKGGYDPLTNYALIAKLITLLFVHICTSLSYITFSPVSIFKVFFLLWLIPWREYLGYSGNGYSLPMRKTGGYWCRMGSTVLVDELVNVYRDPNIWELFEGKA